MIGHWLLHLSPDAEDALLTHALAASNRQCVVATAAGALSCGNVTITRPIRAVPLFSYQTQFYYLKSVPGQYDDLVERFGVPRIASAIRNRILANQARRVLSGVPAFVKSLRGAATPTEPNP